MDQCCLQARIVQCKNTVWDKKQSPEKWALKEGSISPDFLHLEDKLHGSIDITKLYSSDGDIVSGDDVLTVMKSFYTDLYEAQDQVSKSEIDTFLEKIQIPELVSEIEEGDITEQEVHKAIEKLKIGKSPGTDGLTASFYKKFATFLVPHLVCCYNKAFITGELIATQRVAIIMLLYKKGDVLDMGNYRPISLTNVDYKILAYILLSHFQPFLDKIIHPS